MHFWTTEFVTILVIFGENVSSCIRGITPRYSKTRGRQVLTKMQMPRECQIPYLNLAVKAAITLQADHNHSYVVPAVSTELRRSCIQKQTVLSVVVYQGMLVTTSVQPSRLQCFGKLESSAWSVFSNREDVIEDCARSRPPRYSIYSLLYCDGVAAVSFAYLVFLLT